ncbi:MFS transporter [Candidatus Woesearchaeota archaeon]|nr:MFS transporter [Candidatus Woesearchaeota archaeon]
MRFDRNQKKLIINGGLWAAYEGFTSAFLAAFALTLGASNTVIGAISAMPFVALIFSQIPGAKLIEYVSRKKIYVTSTTISRLLWIFIIITPYFFKEHPLFVITFTYFLIRYTEYVTDASWTTTAADITPVKKRGILFGTRNMFLVFGLMAASTIGAFYLDLFPKNSPHGFTTIFTMGILIGLLATTQFGKIKIPPYQDHKHHQLKEFFSRKTLKPYTSIIFFFNFAYSLASPLFVVYILKNLGLSYKIYIGTIIITSILKMLSNRHWGIITDRYGDKPVAVICMFGTALVPLTYLFVTPNTLWLIVPAQIISGIAWAGVDLSAFNLLLDFTNPKRRATEIAQHNMIIAIPLIISPIFGGILADNIQHFVITGIPFVFLVSAILRLISSGLMYRISEPRAKRKYDLLFVFKRAVAIHPEKFAEHLVNGIVARVRNRF